MNFVLTVYLHEDQVSRVFLSMVRDKLVAALIGTDILFSGALAEAAKVFSPCTAGSNG